jgi:molybdopterin converting factor subunit 1
MRCQVLVFAQLREAIGCDRIELDLRDGATVGDALDRLSQQHASVAQLRSKIAVAVDEKYAAMSAPLRDGCTIALIPPVSGG